MPLQNRVQPTGEIIAHPARGTLTGNRGIIHRVDGTLGVSRWSHKHWITCRLAHPRGQYHGPMPDRGWTALFFLDEAVALAAGHRPCAYCRPESFRAWTIAWRSVFGNWPGVKAADSALHAARMTRNRQQIRHEMETIDLPDYSFVTLENQSHLFLRGKLYPYTPAGYGTPRRTPQAPVSVLTPTVTVKLLTGGFSCQVMSSLLP